MDIISVLKKELLKDRQKLKLSIESAKDARDNAPSAMESHHDTTRNQSEKLVMALEQKLKELDEKIERIPGLPVEGLDTLELWHAARIQINNKTIKVLLVPEGYGGKTIDSIKTVSIDSQLGKAVIHKTNMSSFKINGGVGKIISFS